jgi:hypothetical protein
MRAVLITRIVPFTCSLLGVGGLEAKVVNAKVGR